MPRILLISDTAKPIGDLRAALEESGHEVVDVVADVGALLHAVQTHRPDVVMLDVDSPSRDALEQLAMLGLMGYALRLWWRSCGASGPLPLILLIEAEALT